VAQKERTKAGALAAVERLLDAPYWVIDVLPSQVPADAGRRFFKAEGLLLKGLRREFAKVLIKLSCYHEFVVARGEGQKIARDPKPKKLKKWVERGSESLSLLLPSEDALIVVPTDSTCMALYNSSPQLLEQVQTISASEGLFVWQPSDASDLPKSNSGQ